MNNILVDIIMCISYLFKTALVRPFKYFFAEFFRQLCAPPTPMRKLVLSEISCGNTPPPSCRMSATMIPKILHQMGLRLTKKAAIGPKRAGNELSADNSIFRPKITFIFGQNNCRMGGTIPLTLRKKSAKLYLKRSQKRWG